MQGESVTRAWTESSRECYMRGCVCDAHCKGGKYYPVCFYKSFFDESRESALVEADNAPPDSAVVSKYTIRAYRELKQYRCRLKGVVKELVHKLGAPPDISIPLTDGEDVL